METNIGRTFEDAKDGDLVKLVLKNNNLPRVKGSFIGDHYIRIIIDLEKVSARPAYGMGESSLIKSVVGYYGGLFGDEENIEKQQAIIYPMSQEVLTINTEPPIRIEVPLTEI